MSSQSTPTSNGSSRRAAQSPRLVEVLEEGLLTPRMKRIVFGGPGLMDFDAGAFTDHYVKLQLPPTGADYRAPFNVKQIHSTRPRDQWPRTRTYTVRSWHLELKRLTIDFVVHGDEGVASAWARAATVGDTLQLVGPGGDYTPNPSAAWHLMVGDASVIPAIAASLERVPPNRPVHVLLQVGGREDELPLRSSGRLKVTWLHDVGDQVLVEGLRALQFPAGGVDGFVHGEAEAVRAVRRYLIVERGIPRDSLSVSGYWKRSRTEEGWREQKADWKRQVEADAAE